MDASAERYVTDSNEATKHTACPRCGSLPGDTCRNEGGDPLYLVAHLARVDSYRHRNQEVAA